ncbi:MAG: hypothetical protein KH704_13545 [Clostridiales bacterium]|nr:hypothetical protein [Clostridiales bacterium]
MANINRSSFYYHFDGVSMALEWMISGFLKEYLQLLFDIPKGDNDVLLEPNLLLAQEERICALIQQRRGYLELFFRSIINRIFGIASGRNIKNMQVSMISFWSIPRDVPVLLNVELSMITACG